MEIEGIHLHARLAPERSLVLDTDYLIGPGTRDERRWMRVGIDCQMCRDEMKLVEKTAAPAL